MKITEKLVDITTNEEKIIEREMTADEIAQKKLDEEYLKARAVESASKDAAKQAVLAKLGLTADEVAALLG